MDHQTFDTTRKYVRVLEKRDDGLVGFEFAIGEPELFVELLLPQPAFAEFCEANAVTMLAESRAGPAQEGSEEAQWEWSLHQATHQRFK